MDKKVWAITGAAGFIGSHLVEKLLLNGQRVVGIDNLSTGKWENLQEVLSKLPEENQHLFSFYCEDISQVRMLEKSLLGVDVVLHQAALASVPLSIEDPVRIHETNVTGFLNILDVCRRLKVPRVVFASSSAVYGSNQSRIKKETDQGELLSPYAVSKITNEMYAQQFFRHYELETIGLRYFNVFGPRQDPHGAYAAVIPKWIKALQENQPLIIYGDGSITRDFCYIDDVTEANLQAGWVSRKNNPFGKVFNICSGKEVTLSHLAQMLINLWKIKFPQAPPSEVIHQPGRAGDILQSCGSNQLAREFLHYKSEVSLKEGLSRMINALQ